MKKKSWRLVFTYISLLLCLALLVSCGGEEPAPEVVEATEAPAVEEPAEEPTEAPAEEEPAEAPAEEEPAESMEEAAMPATLDKIFYGDTWTWPYQAEQLANMSRGRFFVPIQDESKIAVLDPDATDYALTFVETDFIQPHHPWIAPGMRYNWINFQSEGVEGGQHDAIAIQDTQTLEIIKYIQTGTNDPFHMAFSPTEDVLVTADIDNNAGRVHIFDTAAMEYIGAVETTGLRTRDITISHDGRYAFIGHQGYDPDNNVLGAVDVLDIANQEIVASFGEGRCRSGKMNNAGTIVLYSCDRTDQIVAIDVQNLEEITRIQAPEGSGPFNISFRGDDKFAYVGLSSAGQLGVIDMDSLEIVKTLDSGTDTNSTYMHPTAPIAITTNDGSDTHVTVINTETNEVIKTIETGGKSTHNGQWSPDGRWFLVSNRGGDTLTLLSYDEASGSVDWYDDILVGFGANGVHWAPYFCGVAELTPENVDSTENLPMAGADGSCGSFDDTAAAPAEEGDMDGEMASTADKVFYGDTWTWPYQPAQLAHMSRGRFFVPVQDESKIAIIDPDADDYGLTFVETDFIQPHHPWIAPGMRYNWINFQSEGVEGGQHDAIAIQDTQTLEIIKYIQTGTNDPFHMAFSPTEDVLVTADIDDNAGRVHIFDTAAMELIASVETTGLRTRDITISHDGRYAFIGHQGYDPDNGVLGAVDVLDIANQEIVASFGEGRCRSGKMNNAGTIVLYSCDRADQIIAIDVQNLEEIGRIQAPEGSGPFNISFRGDDKFAYVGLSSAGQLGVIDMDSLEIVKTLDSGTNTNSTYMHPTAPIAITTNDGSDTHVTVINTETNEVISTIETGGKSTHNGQWSPDGRWFLVTNRGGDTVTLLAYDDASGTVEWYDDILVGFGANGVHWAPYFCGVSELTANNVQEATNEPSVDADGTCGSL